jgi:hypothetical protein
MRITFLSEPPALAGGLSLEGCQIVAGGQSEAETTGQLENHSPGAGVRKTVAPLQGADQRTLLSGGLRFALTTGYYLPALQAEILCAALVSLLSD